MGRTMHRLITNSFNPLSELNPRAMLRGRPASRHVLRVGSGLSASLSPSLAAVA